MMNFTAIDFETATGARDSACSVAVVTIRAGALVDSYYTLIQPPANRYSYFNTKIHGLTEADTADAADFAGIWPELEAKLEGQLVVAHNAKFDMSVLRSCLARYGLQAPAFSYCDTVAIARRAWPNLANHKLGTVGAYLNLHFHHHDALEDAKACAAIPIRAGLELADASMEALVHHLGVRVEAFESHGSASCGLFG